MFLFCLFFNCLTDCQNSQKILGKVKKVTVSWWMVITMIISEKGRSGQPSEHLVFLGITVGLASLLWFPGRWQSWYLWDRHKTANRLFFISNKQFCPSSATWTRFPTSKDIVKTNDSQNNPQILKRPCKSEALATRVLQMVLYLWLPTNEVIVQTNDSQINHPNTQETL